MRKFMRDLLRIYLILAAFNFSMELYAAEKPMNEDANHDFIDCDLAKHLKSDQIKITGSWSYQNADDNGEHYSL
jgi:hypothetical protein